MRYYHVDVFSHKVMSGNGLTVVFMKKPLEQQVMQDLAREFKQFETAFVRKINTYHYEVKIFTVEEELDFAGHPVMGAVATIHDHYYRDHKEVELTIQLNKKSIQTHSVKREHTYHVEMNQGQPEYLGGIDREKQNKIIQALGLNTENLSEKYPMEVVSTGLKQLLIPLQSGLDRAKIKVDNFEELLEEVGAKFIYLVDMEKMEGRTWDNKGAVEDVATGSAAGAVGAYMYQHKAAKEHEKINLYQGRFVGRPSRMTIKKDEQTGDILVSGEVTILVNGWLNLHTRKRAYLK